MYWSGGLMLNREVPIEGERTDNVEAFLGATLLVLHLRHAEDEPDDLVRRSSRA